MMRKAVFVGAASVLLALAATPAVRGQGSTFEEVTGGKTFPNAIKAKELTGEWRRLVTSGPSDINPYGGGYQLVLSELGLGVYYTKGQTVVLGGETYLVAYRPQVNAREVMQQMRFFGGPDEETEPPRLARDASLVLSLLNLRTTGSMNDIRPFDPAQDLERELTAQEADPASTENLRRLGATVIRYARGHGQRLPQMTDVATVRRVFFPYVVRRSTMLVHPRTKEAYRPNPLLSNKRMDEVRTPAKAILFYEASVGADGQRGVVYLDGRAARVPDAQWAQVKKASDAVEIAKREPPKPAARAARRR